MWECTPFTEMVMQDNNKILKHQQRWKLERSNVLIAPYYTEATIDFLMTTTTFKSQKLILFRRSRFDKS